MAEPALIQGIRTGPCAELIHCEDSVRVRIASGPLCHSPGTMSRRVISPTPVRAPEAFAIAGYYPMSYCVRHDAASGTHRVTLEGLVYRQAA